MCFSDLYKTGLLILFTTSLIACGGGDGDSNNGPLPDEITIRASTDYPLHSEGAFYEVHVKKGETYTLDTFVNISPYHPDIEPTYSWNRSVYEKSLTELYFENGSMNAALATVDSELNFSYEASVTETATWDITETGYISYSIKVGASGYYIPYTPMTSVTQLPSSSRNLIYIRVYISDSENI